MSDVLLFEPARISPFNNLICSHLTTFIQQRDEAVRGEEGRSAGKGREGGKEEWARIRKGRTEGGERKMGGCKDMDESLEKVEEGRKAGVYEARIEKGKKKRPTRSKTGKKDEEREGKKGKKV